MTGDPFTWVSFSIVAKMTIGVRQQRRRSGVGVSLTEGSEGGSGAISNILSDLLT